MVQLGRGHAAGAGHFLYGLTITSNVFYARSGNIDRVEAVDSTHATLAYNSFRNVHMHSNTFTGVALRAESPMLVEHTQSTAADTWAVDTGGLLPFGGRARNVVGLVFEGAVSNSANATQYVTPYVQVEQGAGAQFANLKWPVAVKGKAQVTIRVDNPA